MGFVNPADRTEGEDCFLDPAIQPVTRAEV
jgi:hypothetical protein